MTDFAIFGKNSPNFVYPEIGKNISLVATTTALLFLFSFKFWFFQFCDGSEVAINHPLKEFNEIWLKTEYERKNYVSIFTFCLLTHWNIILKSVN